MNSRKKFSQKMLLESARHESCNGESQLTETGPIDFHLDVEMLMSQVYQIEQALRLDAEEDQSQVANQLINTELSEYDCSLKRVSDFQDYESSDEDRPHPLAASEVVNSPF
jgi:hypothetical protein